MKDTLNDVIQNTYDLGFVDLVRVVGTDKETTVFANAEDKSVMMSGVLNSPVADFIGVFGVPNLGRLKAMINHSEYSDNAQFTVLSKDTGQPSDINLNNKTGDFESKHRLMSKAIAEEKVKAVTFKGATWSIVFNPSIAAIHRLHAQASFNSDETTFTTTVDNGNLTISFGDPATHSGNFVFQPGVTGKLTRAWQWPVKQFLKIMDLPGNKTIHISDQGVAMVTVDSGLAVYTYYLPAQSK